MTTIMKIFILNLNENLNPQDALILQIKLFWKYFHILHWSIHITWLEFHNILEILKLVYVEWYLVHFAISESASKWFLASVEELWYSEVKICFFLN